MCGVLGIISQDDVVGDLYDGLLTLQHRGQDAAGMITYDGQFHTKRGLGLVSEVFDDKNILRLKGKIGLGHVRYSTVGLNASEDVQPFWVNSPYGIALCHNGNLANFHDLKDNLWKYDLIHVNSGCDAEIILNVFAHELSKKKELNDRYAINNPVEDIFHAVRAVFNTLVGAYSVVAFVAGVGLVAFRDPNGIRPLIMGERVVNGKKQFAFASESVALDILSFDKKRDVKNGECIIVDFNSNIYRMQLADKPHTPCIFEWIYFARPDSTIDKINVYKMRVNLGKFLAEKWSKYGVDIDVVMPIPDSARSSAVFMARTLDKRYREGFVKNRYMGRYFIMPSQKKRSHTIKHKLNPLPLEFENRDVLLVDDSIVRGSTSKKIIEAARKAGAKKVCFASTSAPLVNPCVYGIDMSTKEELVARGKSVDEIREIIGADVLVYQDIDKMEEACRLGNPEIKQFCTACFSGKYPTPVSDEMFDKIEHDRKACERCNK